MGSFPVVSGPFSAELGALRGGWQGHLPTSILLTSFGLSRSLKLMLSSHPVPDTSPQSLTPAFPTSVHSRKMGSCYWCGPRMPVVLEQSHFFQAVVKALQIIGNFINNDLKGPASARALLPKGRGRISCQHWEEA